MHIQFHIFFFYTILKRLTIRPVKLPNSQKKIFESEIVNGI